MAGRRVVLRLRVRRFACEDVSCGRRTFVEQVAGLTRRYSQRTERLRSALAEVGLAVAGRAGARLADVFGAKVSRNTVLRLVDALPEPQPQIPRVVGVDEYAMRKGRVYGTVLVDVETRRPVDLLPDREAGTLAAWLAERPGIEVVCRDRAPFFAEGASIGAPTAVQVADRFHLWHNLGEAAERCISRHRSCLRATAAEVAPEKAGAQAPADSGSPWPTGHRFADRARGKHATVHALLAAGHSRRSIQRQLGMTYRTVQRLADAATPEDLFQGQWQNRRTKLDDFKPYLNERWSEGCTNAWTLWEEIKTHGYRGGYGAVRAYLRPFRTTPTAPAARPPSPRTVARWILTHPDTLPPVWWRFGRSGQHSLIEALENPDDRAAYDQRQAAREDEQHKAHQELMDSLACTDCGDVPGEESTWVYGTQGQVEWTRRPGGRCWPCHQDREERLEREAEEQLEAARAANRRAAPVLVVPGFERGEGRLLVGAAGEGPAGPAGVPRLRTGPRRRGLGPLMLPVPTKRELVAALVSTPDDPWWEDRVLHANLYPARGRRV
ncbi:ISL3 family transposase [Kitasatospora sp. NPDC057692]|uniref:ISL3 family transposase n=1 Tax=Kitasatospora sp. NPDC057692 TaxID=3346215 RepID=UPI0036A7EC4E